ncbi:MAG TPA: hypothetical protein VL426_05970, partial [Candidatus Binatia bacterium]|nr:hypothetical protein [Candidatus Binatia bacterium]
MDKPSSAEKAVERARGAVSDQIERIVKMARSMKMEPDLSPVWDGEEFRGLPPETQAEVIAKAKKEGYATPEPAAPAAPEHKESEQDTRTEGVRGQITRIAKMARSMKMEPDLSPVWDGADFKSLPADLQDAVRAWAADQGFPTGTEAAAAEPEPASEPAPQSRETRETKERREGPKRKFMRYRVLQDNDGFAVHEDYQEWDDEAKAYRTKTLKTSIGFTGPLLEKLNTDADVADTVAGFAGQVRGELDADGVKIFIDRPKNDPEKLYPKWKYTLEGKTVQEPIKLDDIPPELVTLVKSDRDYFRSPA